MAYTPTVYYIYFGRSRLNRDAVKVGYSMNPQRRLKSLNADLILTVACLDEEHAREREVSLHKSLDHARIDGEWFERDALFGAYLFLKEVDDEDFKETVTFVTPLLEFCDLTDEEFIEYMEGLPEEERNELIRGAHGLA